MMIRRFEIFYYKAGTNLESDKNGRGIPKFQTLGGIIKNYSIKKYEWT